LCLTLKSAECEQHDHADDSLFDGFHNVKLDFAFYRHSERIALKLTVADTNYNGVNTP
jgi:hypothetical protein